MYCVLKSKVRVEHSKLIYQKTEYEDVKNLEASGREEESERKREREREKEGREEECEKEIVGENFFILSHL